MTYDHYKMKIRQKIIQVYQKVKMKIRKRITVILIMWMNFCFIKLCITVDLGIDYII